MIEHQRSNEGTDARLPLPLATDNWQLTTAHVGMLTFLLSEAAFFSTLIVAYLVFLRQIVASDPSPARVFDLPMVIACTICLVASSVTVHFAERAARHGTMAKFFLFWLTTILLGILFLLGTAREWAELIGTHRLTISRNMFGTTYFTLVGFHAAHVTVGAIVMSVIMFLALRRQIDVAKSAAVECVAWYWHFVDVVWVVVFTVVYVVGR